MVNIEEKTLNEALAALNLEERPRMGNGDDVWTKAIVLVRRSLPHIKSYAVCEKDSKGRINITQDFGMQYSCSLIAGITAFYPVDADIHIEETADSEINVTAEEIPTEMDIKDTEDTGIVTDYENVMKAIKGERAEDVAPATAKEKKKVGKPKKSTTRKTTKSKRYGKSK